MGRIPAIVCQYLNHYVAVVYNAGALWLMDDSRVTPMGNDFGVVVDRATASRYFPQIVFFEVLPVYFVMPGGGQSGLGTVDGRNV